MRRQQTDIAQRLRRVPNFGDAILFANNAKLRLGRGEVFVLANIRGGGEFGPARHEAGLQSHRQIIYDDFATVARDLIGGSSKAPGDSASKAVPMAAC
jgi:prolyl oligopeptidase PreP (S9A serine peptidase family)